MTEPNARHLLDQLADTIRLCRDHGVKPDHGALLERIALIQRVLAAETKR